MGPGSRSRSLSSGGAVAPTRWLACPGRRGIDTRLRDPAARVARVLQIRWPSLISRAQGRPGARCTRGLACKFVIERTHTSIQVQRKQSGLPCAMVLTVSFVLSPATGLSCHCHPRKFPFANLTPASGRQDHTTSPSALARFVKRTISVHRIPLPASVTIASRPSLGTRRCG